MTNRSLPHWLVQTNLGAGSGLEGLLEALDTEGVSYSQMTIIPFSDRLPTVEVPADRPVFFYGSTLAVALAARDRPWSPGVWFDAAQFNYSAWATHYGDHLLNAPQDSHQTTLGALLDWPGLGAREEWFVRPERDLKEFNGAVWETGALRAFVHDVVQSGGYPQLGPDTPVVVSPPPWDHRRVAHLCDRSGRHLGSQPLPPSRSAESGSPGAAGGVGLCTGSRPGVVASALVCAGCRPIGHRLLCGGSPVCSQRRLLRDAVAALGAGRQSHNFAKCPVVPVQGRSSARIKLNVTQVR